MVLSGVPLCTALSLWAGLVWKMFSWENKWFSGDVQVSVGSFIMFLCITVYAGTPLCTKFDLVQIGKLLQCQFSPSLSHEAISRTTWFLVSMNFLPTRRPGGSLSIMIIENFFNVMFGLASVIFNIILE